MIKWLRWVKFKTSDSILNSIYKAAYWTIRGNYRGMPTDCPQRDERMGWLKVTMNSYGESFIFDNDMLYSKWMVDISSTRQILAEFQMLPLIIGLCSMII